MIWQLKYAGVFHQISGLIIGHFTNLKDNSISFGMSLEEIILEKLNEFNFPVIFDFPAGHEDENLAIPFGVKLKLEAKYEYVKLYISKMRGKFNFVTCCIIFNTILKLNLIQLFKLEKTTLN